MIVTLINCLYFADTKHEKNVNSETYGVLGI